MNWMKKVAVALVCLLPLGLQAAKVDTLQVKSPSMNKSIEVVVVVRMWPRRKCVR